VENIFVINQLSQLKAFNSELKIHLINELMLNPATGQQLSKIFGLSKQKMHYNLKALLNANLIEVTDFGNNKEVYYRAKAKNYFIDFSLGNNLDCNSDNRSRINEILKENNLDLSRIAANLLENSLRMQAREKLLIVTGDYNMPLVKKILVEASKRQIETELIYRDKEMLEAKHDQFSLATYNWDFENFNKQLKSCQVYLYLNGESMYNPLNDPEKIKLQQRAFVKSREIISKNGIRIAMMEGLMQDELTEQNILSEINFWHSLDIDYDRLADETEETSRRYNPGDTICLQNEDGTDFLFRIDKIVCDYGSFTPRERQCSSINIPGGEIIFLPQTKSLNGTISAKQGFLQGKLVSHPVLKIMDNKIVEFTAETNQELIASAINEGGADGGVVSMLTLGTNYNMNTKNIDPLYRCKSKGLVTVRWGENRSIGGTVQGQVEWQVQLENPEMKVK